MIQQVTSFWSSPFAGTQQIDLDISAFPDGMLLLRLVGKEGVSSKLLMKGN